MVNIWLRVTIGIVCRPKHCTQVIKMITETITMTKHGKPDNAEIFVYEATKVFFQFVVIIIVLVSFLQFISIPILWFYGRYTYFNYFSVGTVFRKNLFLAFNSISYS